MSKFHKVNVSEQELEDLVRRNPGQIEEGLVYVDHQKPAAGGRLDVLLVDSVKSLVVAELKVTEDDDMLVQGLDYCDDVAAHAETWSRLYKAHEIDPTQQVRLILVAPSFSQTLMNRCKWLNIQISLFTFNCLKIDGDGEVYPVFAGLDFPLPSRVIEAPTVEEHLNHITDTTVRAKVSALLNEIKSWNPEHISVDAVQNWVSMRINGRVFAAFTPRRQWYWLDTYDANNDWVSFPIKSDDNLATVKPLIKAAMETQPK